MKHFGSYFEYRQERDRDLMRAYREDLYSCDVILLSDVWQRVADMPSARFWVSEERAAIVIARLFNGDKLQEMRPLKRQMFLEIFKRVKILKDSNPSLSISKCCMKVVNSPAPKFYMTPLSVRQTIYKIKRDWHNQQNKDNRIFIGHGINSK